MNTVLYYPHTQPRPPWLRLASLCWDEVYLLSFDRYATSYKPAMWPELAELDAALGGVIRASEFVDEYVDENLIDEFKGWVDEREAQLRQDLDDGRQVLFGIHESKMYHPPIAGEDTLREWLVGRGLARIERPEEQGDGDRWEATEMAPEVNVWLPRNIALQYLALIASRAAESHGRDMATDSAIFTDPVFHTVRSVRGQVATSTVEAFLPDAFETIEPERLAQLREDLSAQRLRYQAEIQGIVTEFEDLASEAEFGRLQTRIAEIAQQRVDDTKASYRRAKLGLVTQAVGMTLTPPAVATSVASLLSIGIFAPLGVAMAVAVFSASAVLRRAEAKAAVARSPWSYVLDLAQRTG